MGGAGRALMALASGAVLLVCASSAMAQGYYRYYGPGPYAPMPEEYYPYAPPPPPPRYYEPPPEAYYPPYSPEYLPPSYRQPYQPYPRYYQQQPRYRQNPAVPRAAEPKRPPSSDQRTASRGTTGPQGPVNCSKAQDVVAGYGFGNVKPVTCEGKLYTFSALRDGKTYRVQVSAATGEITEVKKQP